MGSVAETPVELHVVSDSTGETAARLVTALEAQFPDQPFVEVRHPRVESVEDLARAVSRAKGRPAVVVYTLVKPEWRQAMRAYCRSGRVHYCDLLGHPIDSVRRVSGMAARMTPGARAALNETYFKRMEAIEFAVKYDDGVGARGLEEADVVLVGVSRTSKTPLSIYLGYLGHKAANVPVVKGIAPPPELFRLPAAKIVGLTIDPERLAEIREARVRSMGGSKKYAELLEVYDELEEAAKVHRRLGCPVIDVSDLSIEETAARIVKLVQGRQEAAAS
jgi:regulator of PEP synthase PpsR (kinase-PPPase family)